MRRWGAWALAGTVAGSLFSVASSAVAQGLSPADLDAINRQQQQILRDQEDRQRQREEEHRARSRTLPRLHEEEEQGGPGETGGATCLPVNDIRLDGLTEVAAADFAETLAPFQGRCLGLAEIDALVRALTNRAIDLGYSTTRFYIPQQDLSSGTLHLVVQEGKVEGLKIEGDDSDFWPEGGRVGTAFPGVVGRTLNLRDIEQGLDQINRLRANNAKLEIVPGQTTAGSQVAIKNQQQAPWFVSVGTDNSGSVSSGERQGYSQVELDDLLHLNDLWTFEWRRSLVDDRSQRKSDSVNGFVSIPYGYWTASLSASWFDYRSPVVGLNQTFGTSGTSRTWKARVERVIHRNDISKTSVSTSLNVKNSLNYLEDTLLQTGSRRLAVAAFDAAHTRRLLGGSLSVTATHEEGLHTLGSKSDAARSEASPEAQFEKWAVDASYWRPLPFFADDFALSFSTTARGQWTPDTLFSTERISVGGQYSVRGFKDRSASGDIGGYLRNDLRLALPQTGNDLIDRGLGRVSFSLGYDIGAIRQDWRDDEERGRVSGVSLGLSTAGGLVPLSLTWARPLQAPSSFGRKEDVWYFSAGLSL